MAGDGYGGRPMWQWILIYLIVGGVIYFLIYYFVLGKGGSNSGSINYGATTPSTQQSTPSGSSAY